MRDKDPEPGDTAELVGLSRTDLNRRRVEVQARATGKDGTPRFVVQVLGADGGGPVKVKAKNLKLDCGADPALDTLVEALTLATGAAPTASDGELGAASDSPPAAQTRDWIATYPKGPQSYSGPPLPWPADAEFDARNPPNTPYGRKVNTSGVYAALSNGKVKKMTRSIFNKWGNLQAMTFVPKSPYEGFTKDNTVVVLMGAQIPYCAECPGTWADDLTDDEIALVMDPEWRRKAALPMLGMFAVFMEQRLTAWGF